MNLFRWLSGSSQHEPKLVDLGQLKTLMNGVELSDPKFNEYINARRLNYVEWWDSRASKAKRKYLAPHGAVVIGGALIPALVGLGELRKGCTPSAGGPHD